MADNKLVIDVDELKESKIGAQDQPKKVQKRKRAKWLCESLSGERKEIEIETLRQEMEGLFGYYKELMDQKVGFGLRADLSSVESGSLNGAVAVLIEESHLPLSRLVEEVHGRVKEKMESATSAAVKSSVLLVGQRLMYGVPNAEADVLEDNASSCLWCWETREAKLIPSSLRGVLKIRRTCRKKIHERISALSAMLHVLQNLEDDHTSKHELLKASEKLSKVLNEADIRSFVHKIYEKSSAEMAEKEAKREEKLLIKRLERNKREAEKEKKRMDWELQREKLQIEKELKKQHEEAKKEEKHRDKVESEMRKQLRKQEAERRREKEEAKLKNQLSIQRQASVMERFLKRSKTSPCSSAQSSTKAESYNLRMQENRSLPGAVTLAMDSTLSSSEEISLDDIWKLNLSSWCQLGRTRCLNRNQGWGMRRKPKIKLFKELKLTANREPCDDVLIVEKPIDGWEEHNLDDNSSSNGDVNIADGVARNHSRKQLLQFDKAHRPAFYGIWPKKSNIVGPRHPWRKDPELDYDIDSDEEWEEEEPGESLSDCDKEDEEESQEACSRVDEEDGDDGFFVPDGYLSENEGVQVDRMETDGSAEDSKSSPSCTQDVQTEEFYALLRQQKYLNYLTDHALRKSQPLIISNLKHEKMPLLMADNLSGALKLEQTCLQALSMRAFRGCPFVEISLDNIRDDHQEICMSSGKGSKTVVSAAETSLDSELPVIVSTIQSSSHSISKLVDTLQQKFPAATKSQLKNKVRELSEFVDNRWQVKKEILRKLGMSTSPAEKVGGKTRSIATFFSKRCLPPASNGVSSSENSPQQSLKQSFASQEQKGCLDEHV